MKIFGTDYDGVIINIEPQKAKAFGTILNAHWGTDKQDAQEYWLATGGSSRKSKFNYFYNKQFHKEISDDEYRKIESEYSQLLKSKFYPNLSLLPGALELLKFARSNFDHTFVSSGVPMEEIRYLANINNTSEYFDMILGTNNEYPSKTEHFNKIISEWNPDKIIFVADGIKDMQFAKEANAISIGIPTNRTAGELKQAGATATCNLQDAISAIKALM
ncbi:MAG: hypothetical protein HW400_607 [Candidatus Levybacteria bacterium]|nr:hypothetical protein [Candidatus Levybacteria bacterium]